MDRKAAKVCEDAIYHGNSEYPTKKNSCQMFMREVEETAHGPGVSEKIRAASAKLAVGMWQAQRWGFPASELAAHGGLQEGDVLYKTSGPYGHTGMVCRPKAFGGKLMVGENSSTKIGRVRGALGFRTLSQFGAFEYVGRLPASITDEIIDIKLTGNIGSQTKEPRLIIAIKPTASAKYQYFHIVTAKLEKGHFRDRRANINRKLNLVGTLPDAPTPNIPDYLIKQFSFKLAEKIEKGNHLSDRENPIQYVFLQAPKGWKAPVK